MFPVESGEPAQVVLAALGSVQLMNAMLAEAAAALTVKLADVPVFAVTLVTVSVVLAALDELDACRDRTPGHPR